MNNELDSAIVSKRREYEKKVLEIWLRELVDELWSNPEDPDLTKDLSLVRARLASMEVDG